MICKGCELLPINFEFLHLLSTQLMMQDNQEKNKRTRKLKDKNLGVLGISTKKKKTYRNQNPTIGKSPICHESIV